MRARGPLLLVGLLGLAAAQPLDAPWAGGVAPTPQQVELGLAHAIQMWKVDRLLEFGGAVEDEVDRESTIVSQPDLSIFDLEAMRVYGHRLFQVSWRRDMGLGDAAGIRRLRPVHEGDAPGLDAMSCDGCHMQGGQDGAGSFSQGAMLFGDGDAQGSATRRNPPAMLGAGMVQQLAREMSAELAEIRQRALDRAREKRAEVTVELDSKGVQFGSLTARPDGTLDLSKVEGVSPDLVVRPFGWKGSDPSIRRFVEDAARTHLGVLSQSLVERNVRAAQPARLGAYPDPEDPDGDEVRRELEEGSLSMLAIYVALLEVPVVLPPSDPALMARWAAGSARFDALGCAGCHVRSLLLEDRMGEERPDTPGLPPIRYNLLSDGDLPRGTDRVALFSDLKRHAMGPGLAESAADPMGIPADVFLTRPLWGLAESAPYLHDGRAPTIQAAILAHGGEAQAARDAVAALSPEAQAELQIFLLSLSRAPTLRVAR